MNLSTVIRVLLLAHLPRSIILKFASLVRFEMSGHKTSKLTYTWYRGCKFFSGFKLHEHFSEMLKAKRWRSSKFSTSIFRLTLNYYLKINSSFKKERINNFLVYSLSNFLLSLVSEIALLSPDRSSFQEFLLYMRFSQKIRFLPIDRRQRKMSFSMECILTLFFQGHGIVFTGIDRSSWALDFSSTSFVYPMISPRFLNIRNEED